MEKKERTYYTESLIDSAIDELQDRLKEEATVEIDDEIKIDETHIIDELDLDDIIAEIADNNIPIYTYDLLQYASNNFDLIYPNELAGDEPDVIKIIQANIYELLHTELYAYVTTIRDNKKETEKE